VGGRNLRQRAAVTLLRNIRNRRVLTRHPLVETQTPQQRAEFVDRLPTIVTGLMGELAAESAQQERRFGVLRKSDIEGKKHAAIAREMGLSRSQFYRDLHDARECFAEALEGRLALQARRGKIGERDGYDARFVAIEALRDGGRFEQAEQLARRLGRESDDPAMAVRALCLAAELQTQLGAFAEARSTMNSAHSLLPRVADERRKGLLEATCDLADFEVARCQGVPASDEARNLLVERLRRGCNERDPAYAATLVEALMEESTILFERDDAARAQTLLDEASSIAAREGLERTRLGVDVEIRASGIRALAPDRVSTALNETAAIVNMGNRTGDVWTLRAGMQMMAAHLLTLGRTDEARHYALEAWALIDLFGSKLDRSIVLSNLARIEIHRRDGHQALKWIEMAHDLQCDAFSISHALEISRAEALVLIGHPDSGAKLAHSSSDRVRQWARLFGRARLAEATALYSLNRAAEARAASAEAVELSRGAAGPLLRLRALDLNVKLTGSSASRAELRELQAALNA
jgi:hypothetical protein